MRGYMQLNASGEKEGAGATTSGLAITDLLDMLLWSIKGELGLTTQERTFDYICQTRWAPGRKTSDNHCFWSSLTGHWLDETVIGRLRVGDGKPSLNIQSCNGVIHVAPLPRNTLLRQHLLSEAELWARPTVSIATQYKHYLHKCIFL